MRDIILILPSMFFNLYRLPMDLYQTAKVSKVLMLLNKGKGSEFKGKSLKELDVQVGNVFSSSESENEDEVDDPTPINERVLGAAISRANNGPTNENSRK